MLNPDFMNMPTDPNDNVLCAMRNSEKECEGLKVKQCRNCKFFKTDEDYDWDKEKQCPRSVLV